VLKGDLHIHTTASDGSLTPAEMADAVVACGLGFFSVADHNSTTGLAAVQEALPENGPLFVRGVELSAQPDEGREIHLLGYGIEPAAPTLASTCELVSSYKRDQLHEIIFRLEREGVHASYHELPLDDRTVYLGRPLVADLLVREGYVESINQAFGMYLGEKAPTFVHMRRFAPARCIEAVHAAGGLAVLAHPTIETVDRWIAPLTEAGLDGVEAYRPALSGNAQLYVEKAAEHFGLFVTGGSDWHGWEVSRRLGDYVVSAEQVRGFFRALDCSPRP
jgi:predicted metal-dependent phosphoesterase TrpH